MVALVSELTKQQNDALGSFVKAWADLKDSTKAAARAYRECVELGIDMRQYVKSESLHSKLLLMADDKLISMSQSEMLYLPANALAALSTFSLLEQKEIVQNGVLVLRGDNVEKVSFGELTNSEIKKVFDLTGDRGRVVSPEEQKDRAQPRPVKRDQIIEVRLSYSEAKEALAAAHNAKKSLPTLIKSLLRKEGIIP